MSETGWEECLRKLILQRDIIAAWPETKPDLAATRCEQSRHRTLGHLRAAQETWLEAVLLFAEKENPSIVRLHPLRLFDERSYGSVPWEEHMDAFLAERDRWIEFVQSPHLDRNRGGKLSRHPETIESLTAKLVGHERHHIDLIDGRGSGADESGSSPVN